MFQFKILKYYSFAYMYASSDMLRMGRVPGMILPAMNVIELIWDNILVLILIISNLMISCMGFYINI